MSVTAPPNRQVLSVSEINRSARQLLEGEFPMVFVEGEISNLARPSSGHWYFTLKDDKSQIRCAMFRNRNQRIRFPVKDGMQVIVRGRISLYEGRGEFQLIAEFLEDAGEGALRLAFEKLKLKLDAEGLFDPAHKQALPDMPAHVGIITSPTGAAIRDVLHVLERRFPCIEVSVIPVQVQGEQSAGQIVSALDFANRYDAQPFDVIVLTRGGGTLEDLWSFNTEEVARAVYASAIPVVCAVGHETDFSIADFVADVRAPTPSAAAEVISPDQSEWMETFVRTERVLVNLMQTRIADHGRHLDHLRRRLRQPGQRVQDMSQRLDDLEMRSRRAVNHVIERARSRLNLAASKLTSPVSRLDAARTRVDYLADKMKHLAANDVAARRQRFNGLLHKLDTLSPLATLRRGYAIVTEGRSTTSVVKRAADVAPGDLVTARLMEGSFTAEVREIDNDSDDGELPLDEN